MQRRRRRVNVGSSSSGSDQVLSLSLFLMLLAFFIVLNSISKFEETKIKPLLDSIEQSFSKDFTPPENTNPSVQESETPSVDEGDVTEKLEALFKSQIPNYESASNKTKGTMHVRLPYSEFREAVMAVGQRTPQRTTGTESGQVMLKGFFLPALIALIRTDQTDVAYRMDIILNLGDNPPHLQNNNPQLAERSIKKMGEISKKLENSGLPTKLQSIGFGGGPEDTVDLVFRPHIPYDPTGGQNDAP